MRNKRRAEALRLNPQHRGALEYSGKLWRGRAARSIGLGRSRQQPAQPHQIAIKPWTTLVKMAMSKVPSATTTSQ